MCIHDNYVNIHVCLCVFVNRSFPNILYVYLNESAYKNILSDLISVSGIMCYNIVSR